MHYPIYRKLCEDNGIAPNFRAAPTGSGAASSQFSIDGYTVVEETNKERKAKAEKEATLPFNNEGLLSFLVQLAVTDDQALSLVDVKIFRALLRYLRPSLDEEDIPHRTMVTEEMCAKALKVTGLLCDRLKNLSSRVSFTFDAGTSRASDPFLAITGHWVDKMFVLHEQLLSFGGIEGSHTGANTGEILAQVFRKYGILDADKLGWGVADNASTCNKAMSYLAKQIKPGRTKWVAKERRGRCMEHSINCTTRAFV